MRHPPVKELIDIPRWPRSHRRCCAMRSTPTSGATLRWRKRVLDADDGLDALKTQVFRELLTYMLQDPATIEPALDLILISRHLERIGDHATNIAEDVIFMVLAKDVRHHDQRRARLESGARSRRPRPRASASRVRPSDTIGRLHMVQPEPLCAYCRRRPVDPAWRPFCSERCKLADLGRWLLGVTTAIPETPLPDDDEDA